MQGKESPVGSNTQETHQYVGPYRLEKTLGKGQTGECVADLSRSIRATRPTHVACIAHRILSMPLFRRATFEPQVLT